MWFAFSSIILIVISSKSFAFEDYDTNSLNEEENFQKPIDAYEMIVGDIERAEKAGAAAEDSQAAGVIPAEETEQLFMELVDVFDDIIDLVDDPENAEKFLRAKGIDRVVNANLMIKHSALRNRLLILLKNLFKVAPLSTKFVIPISVVDRLLDIFENDANLVLKTQALDILRVWLPNGPNVQTRVMKVKGLVPFYNHGRKLESSLIKPLLELFNNILDEHIIARSGTQQRSLVDVERMKKYQRIGLLERLSTPVVCNGLLEIFQAAWQNKATDPSLMRPVFVTLKHIKPYCLDIYKGNAKPKELFNEFKKFVDDTEKENPQAKDWNFGEARSVIQDYIYKLKTRNEF